MSHLGNWEMAARLLMQQRQDLRLLLYMGVKEKEGVERTQKEELRRAGVTIIGVDQESGSPFAAVEGIRLLQAGGLVSMTGDMVWRPDQRRIAGHLSRWSRLCPGGPLYLCPGVRCPDLCLFCLPHRQQPLPVHPFRADLGQGRRAGRSGKRRLPRLPSVMPTSWKRPCVRIPLEWYHFDRFLHTVCRAHRQSGKGIYPPGISGLLGAARAAAIISFSFCRKEG